MFHLPRFLLFRLGSFEAALLKAVTELAENAYCVALTDHLSDVLGRQVSAGQTSRALTALERSGLLVSEKILPYPGEKHRRSRIVYSLSSDGRRVFQGDAPVPKMNGETLIHSGGAAA